MQLLVDCLLPSVVHGASHQILISATNSTTPAACGSGRCSMHEPSHSQVQTRDFAVIITQRLNTFVSRDFACPQCAHQRCQRQQSGKVGLGVRKRARELKGQEGPLARAPPVGRT